MPPNAHAEGSFEQLRHLMTQASDFIEGIEATPSNQGSALYAQSQQAKAALEIAHNGLRMSRHQVDEHGREQHRLYSILRGLEEAQANAHSSSREASSSRTRQLLSRLKSGQSKGQALESDSMRERRNRHLKGALHDMHVNKRELGGYVAAVEYYRLIVHAYESLDPAKSEATRREITVAKEIKAHMECSIRPLNFDQTKPYQQEHVEVHPYTGIDIEHLTMPQLMQQRLSAEVRRHSYLPSDLESALELVRSSEEGAPRQSRSRRSSHGEHSLAHYRASAAFHPQRRW
ncbi:hypothetical protein Rhopal_005450-T1 [Rhodotorula paludigena]|uniref:Uncharacterized protein n=1 Tax=Rhodotorula paludigena TaxID=86838 RepID=A0AAV5GIF1_9BASI|nr:hypothetical protein Rhopal_005450-T1 [Rhodotorula paludigena]